MNWGDPKKSTLRSAAGHSLIRIQWHAGLSKPVLSLTDIALDSQKPTIGLRDPIDLNRVRTRINPSPKLTLQSKIRRPAGNGLDGHK